MRLHPPLRAIPACGVFQPLGRCYFRRPKIGRWRSIAIDCPIGMRQIIGAIGRQLRLCAAYGTVGPSGKFQQKRRRVHRRDIAPDRSANGLGKTGVAPPACRSVICLKHAFRHIIRRQQSHQQAGEIIDMNDGHPAPRRQQCPSLGGDAEHIEHFGVAGAVHSGRTNDGPVER